jgi:hypothetical protein
MNQMKVIKNSTDLQKSIKYKNLAPNFPPNT